MRMLVAVLLVQLAHGADQAHGRLATVDDGYPLEHVRPLPFVCREPIGVRRAAQ